MIYLPFLAFLLVLFSCNSPTIDGGVDVEGPSPDWANPGRGYYAFAGNFVVPGPNGHDGSEVYKRFYWYDANNPANSLEMASSTQSTPVYNFEPILREVRALSNGKVFSFRLRSMYNYAPGLDPSTSKPKAFVPPWLRTSGFYADSDGKSGADVFVPDFNSPNYLDGVERLLAALKNALFAEFGSSWESKIGFIDVGMQGQYGEWHVKYVFRSTGSKYLALSAADKLLVDTRDSHSRPYIDYDRVESGSIIPFKKFENTSGNPAKRIIDAHLNNFKNNQILMFFLYAHAPELEYCFYTQTITTRPVGTRFDGLGKPGFLVDQWQADADKLSYWTGTRYGGAASSKAFQNRWKTAPFVAEFYGPTAVLGGVSDSALDQVSTYHISQVSNGNMTSTGGSASAQWASLSDTDKNYARKIGNSAGYRLAITSSTVTSIGGGQYRVQVGLKNTGVAPYYLPLTAKINWHRSASDVVQTLTGANTSPVAQLMPGQTLNWTYDFTPSGGLSGSTWTPEFYFESRGLKLVFASGKSNLQSLTF